MTTIGVDQNGEYRIAISAQELSALAMRVYGPSRAPGLVPSRVEWQHNMAPGGYSILVIAFKAPEEQPPPATPVAELKGGEG